MIPHSYRLELCFPLGICAFGLVEDIDERLGRLDHLPRLVDDGYHLGHHLIAECLRLWRLLIECLSSKRYFDVFIGANSPDPITLTFLKWYAQIFPLSSEPPARRPSDLFVSGLTNSPEYRARQRPSFMPSTQTDKSSPLISSRSHDHVLHSRTAISGCS